MAIEPKTKGDLDKMTNGLIKLAQEDPSFHFRWAAPSGVVMLKYVLCHPVAVKETGHGTLQFTTANTEHAHHFVPLQPRRGDQPDGD